MVDVWIFAVRAAPERDRYGAIIELGPIIEPGFWKSKGTVETEQEAEEVLRLAARGAMVARATRKQVEGYDGIVGMRADPRSFAKWTGTGGCL